MIVIALLACSCDDAGQLAVAVNMSDSGSMSYRTPRVTIIGSSSRAHHVLLVVVARNVRGNGPKARFDWIRWEAASCLGTYPFAYWAILVYSQNHTTASVANGVRGRRRLQQKVVVPRASQKPKRSSDETRRCPRFPT